MGKLIDFNTNGKKDERLVEISDRLRELKRDFALLLQAYEEEGMKPRMIDTLTEALDALEDAKDVIGDFLAEE